MEVLLILFSIVLLNLDRLTTPNDKLDCFVDCYREIVETLSLCSSKRECIGADDSLPVLLYVLLKATQNKLYSHIKQNYFYIFYNNFFFFSIIVLFQCSKTEAKNFTLKKDMLLANLSLRFFSWKLWTIKH